MADIEPEEIREIFANDTNEWALVRKEGQTDMRYVSGKPWEEKDVTDRKNAGRPCLAPDELGQYVNQAINDVRQNKRGITVTPTGRGANDVTAAFRQGKIRDIEYRSNAQQAYMTMYENAVQRSYGYLRIISRYANSRVSDTPDPSDLDMELRIEPVVNPDMVTPDPYAIRTDFSDGTRLFYHESWSKEDFSRRWKKAAKNRDWSTLVDVAPQWVMNDRLLVAEFWRKELAKQRKLLLIAGPDDQQLAVWADDPAVKGLKIDSLRERMVDEYQVVKYLTNGLEILEKSDWPGQSIPFVSCFGKVLYVDEGAGSRRQILSLVRLARDPYMLYCYYRTCEAELIGMTPKFPYFVYKGQLAPDELKNLQKSLHQPIAVVQVEPLLDETGQQVLPMPQRQPYEPPIQALEIGAEAARRAIQAAMGISPLPTDAQRQNQKSGKALQRIEESGQRGTFHFVDHYDEAITRTGAILDELIPHYYDTPRETSVRKPNDSIAMVRINDTNKKYGATFAEDPQGHPLMAETGDHDVTISVGPTLMSDREAKIEASQALIGNPEIGQIVGQAKMQKILAISLKASMPGAEGEEMAAIIDPPQGQPNPMQAQQAMQENQQLKQQLGKAAEMIKNKTAEKQVELQSKEKIAFAELESKERIAAADRAADREVRLAVAEIGAKTKDQALFYEERARLGVQSADATAQAFDHRHEMALTDVEHQQALEQAEQGQDHALEANEQAAALAPEPAEEAQA